MNIDTINKLSSMSKSVDLKWIEKNSKYYILEFDKKKSIAIVLEATKKEKMHGGFTFSREYHNQKGYYWQFEPTWIDVEWAITNGLRKGHKCDITKDFKKAKALAYQHTK